MVQLIAFVGMTVSLVFLFTKHTSFKNIREKVTDKYIQYQDRGTINYFNVFLHNFFCCDYCCGFWCGIVSLICTLYMPHISYLFTGAIVSYLTFNKE